MPRWHLLALGVIVVLALARGLFWVAVTEVLQADEGSHYAYVQWIATGQGIPVLQDDRVPDEVTQLAKRSPTRGSAASDVSPSAGDARWGAAAEQYEAGQGPLYYSLLAVVSRALSGSEPLARLHALRVASLLLAVTALPLVWLLARAVFPRLPTAWLLGPALLVCWQSFNAGGASITNDALAWPLGVGALAGVALAYRRGPGMGSAAATGLCTGLAVVNKATAVALLPSLVLAALAVAARWRRRPGRLAAWAGLGGLSALLPVAAWLLWQRRAYGDVGVVERFNEVLGPAIGQAALSATTLRWYLNDVSRGLFGQEFFVGGIGPYSRTLLAVLASAAVLGVVATLVRRRGGAALGLLWLATVLPLGFGALVVLVQVALDGYGTIAARYLQPGLAAAAVVVAASAVLTFGRRAGVVVVALLAAVALQIEIGPVDGYVTAVYLRGLPVEGVAPVVVQDQAEGYVEAEAVAVTSSPCPVRLLGVGYRGAPPAEASVTGADGAVRSASLVRTEPVGGQTQMGYYDVAGTECPFRFSPVSGPPLAASASDREAALSLVGRPGDPVARLLCAVGDPQAVRFAQTHHPQHPDLPLGVVRAWPRAWAGAGWAMTGLALGWALYDALRASRRSRAHSSSAPSTGNDSDSVPPSPS